MDKLKKKHILIILFLFSLIILSFNSPKIKSTSVIAFSPKIVPNLSTMTQYSFSRYVLIDNVTLNHGILNMSNIYWINSSASNNEILIHNWFDNLGTCFTVSKPDNITLYIGDKGEPSKVIGATYVHHPGNKTLALRVSKASYVGIHWNSGVSVVLTNPDRKGFFHSCEAEKGYKTMYGFGVIRGGYIQYGFTVTVYCKNERNDVETVKLQLGNDVSFTYNDKTHDITELDPKDYCKVSKEWYPEGSGSAWVNYESDKQYLHVGFNVRFLQVSGNKTVPHYWFLKYQPYHVQQNTTATVTTLTDGTQINEQYATFYVGLSRLPFVEPVYVPWELSFFFIGIGGIFLMNASLFYFAYKIKKKDYAPGIAWGICGFFIAIGLIVVWLWK